MADGAIKESDLIQSDGTIDRIIDALDELNVSYSVLVDTIRKSAKDIVNGLKSVSTATEEGRKEVDMAIISANRLEKAQKELDFAMSDTGKQVAILKDRTSALNKETVNNDKQIQAAKGSYDRLNSELKEQIALWNSLTPAERQAADMGGELLKSIAGTRKQLQDINAQLNPAIEKISELQKAEQRLAYLQSEEGQKLIEVKRQISEVLRGRQAEKQEISEIGKAVERLAIARSDEYAEIQRLNQLTHEQQRIVKLTNQLNNSAVGSYNQLAAQYELNKIKLNAMSAEERNAVGVGKELEEETLNIYKQMIRLQEATGNHRLSVGNYKLAWNGLGNAMNQIVRELPAATMGVNTFFLAISNNIPVLIDEIDKVRQRNKLAQAEGAKTTSVMKTILSSIFSWQSALILLLTALSMNGKGILDWISKQIKGHKVTLTSTELIENMNKELEKTNGSYGQNVVMVQKLAREWNNITSKKEQLQWIKDNKSEFDKLGISIKDVNEAENVFANHTDDMIESLRLRAKAAAAMKLAADKYEESLRKMLEAEQEEYNFERVIDDKGNVTIKKTKKSTREKSNAWDYIVGAASQQGSYGYRAPGTPSMEDVMEANANNRIQNLKDEAKAAELDADAYFQLSEAFNQEADSRLKAANIEKKHRDRKDPRGRQPRDLTDQIWRNDLAIRKKYELSISALQRDEFRKRRIEAIDQTNATIREMQEKFRKNQVFIDNPDGRFKALTPEQRKQIEEQQKQIGAIIENAQRKLQIDLKNIDYEQQIDNLKKLRQVVDWRLDIVEDEIEKEKQLRLKQLDEEIQLYSTKAQTTNGEITVTGTRTPEQIAADQRKRQQIMAEYDQIIYNMRKADIDAQIELVKKGTEEELKLLLKRNEIARQLALAENRAKPVEKRQSESQINAQFDKRGAIIRGTAAMANFDEAQAAADAEFNIVKRNETQITVFKLKAEQDRWRKQIQLAKEGAIEWSDAQMKEAEAMVEGLQRKIDEANKFINLVGDKGLGGALLTKLGFDDKRIAYIENATNIIIDNIKAIIDAEVEAAEKAVQIAQERVDAAQKAYDAEIEARNNGYAHSVVTAKKQLQDEKRNQMQKQKLLEEAQRRQEDVNTTMQAVSLITASANLWQAFSSIPYVGPALAIAAIATMWASFAAAKIKASEVTRSSSQEYGEGGLEILEGGSHASGNDIDLQTKNSKGKNMRAEGGEALAIINKRNTRKYRKMLPQLINSLNNGTFEDKFIGAFKTGDKLAQQINYQTREVDLSRLEEDVRALKRNTEKRYYTNVDGTIIEIKKNVTRYIH